VKIQNFDVALRLVNVGPGWKVISFENPKNNSVAVRLLHVDGYAEELSLSHEELYDNPMGVMQMVTGWIRTRTKAVEPVPQATTTVVSVARPAVLAVPTPDAADELAEAIRPMRPERPARPFRTRLITLDE